jgi:hypothetical protein
VQDALNRHYLIFQEIFLYFYRPLPECSEGAEPAEGSEEDVVLVDSLETELDVSCQAWELLILTLPEKTCVIGKLPRLCPWCGRLHE